MISWLIFRIRWWRWFLVGSPKFAAIALWGIGKYSQDVIFQRWLDAEPKREGGAHEKVQMLAKGEEPKP